jgi:uncharacterized membrane protein
MVLTHFLQGLIILAPIIITAWTVISMFNFVDGILPNILHILFPTWVELDVYGTPKRFPGLGFLLVVVVVVIVGYFSPSFIFGRFVFWFDQLLERTPGVKFIYSTVKDLFEAFAGNKRKFDHPVLVNIVGDDVWQIGFITQEMVKQFGLDDHVAVYVPQSYAFAGHLYMVKPDRIKPIEKLNGAEAMKFCISGGIAE